MAATKKRREKSLTDSKPASNATPTRKEIDNVYELARHMNVVADHYWSQLSQPQPPEQIESIKKELSSRVLELSHALTPELESLIRDPLTLIEMGGRPFRTAHRAALEFGCSVLRYMVGGGDPATNRIPRHNEWSVHRLDMLIEVERNRGLDWLENGWSIPRSPSDWVKIFEKLNVNCRSLKTFERRRKAGIYRQHPDSETKSVRLAFECLPPTYSDSMTA